MRRIGIDYPSEQLEAGGKLGEKTAREILSGKASREVAGTGYFKAMKVKADGGTYGECVQVYYEDLVSRNPKLKPSVAARRAVNRAQRLFRSGGMAYAQETPYLTSTQPINYLEQQLVVDSIPEDKRHLLLIGGLTLANMVRLSRAGIINLDKAYIPDQMPWQLFYPKVKAYLEAA
jgi:hypothetical protein